MKKDQKSLDEQFDENCTLKDEEKIKAKEVGKTPDE